jgi:hypothetical protein
MRVGRAVRQGCDMRARDGGERFRTTPDRPWPLGSLRDRGSRGLLSDRIAASSMNVVLAG